MSSTLIVQLDMERFCEEANIPATYVIEIVEHGIIEPQGRTPDVWRFEDYELV
ncbi:MAG: chaperone modulatory protein CbpM, partial [Pseudomonas sp.]|nr:chaperone modulatory protein CbpM [Pseudomonas sp.]